MSETTKNTIATIATLLNADDIEKSIANTDLFNKYSDSNNALSIAFSDYETALTAVETAENNEKTAKTDGEKITAINNREKAVADLETRLDSLKKANAENRKNAKTLVLHELLKCEKSHEFFTALFTTVPHYTCKGLESDKNGIELSSVNYNFNAVEILMLCGYTEKDAKSAVSEMYVTMLINTTKDISKLDTKAIGEYYKNVKKIAETAEKHGFKINSNRAAKTAFDTFADLFKRHTGITACTFSTKIISGLSANIVKTKKDDIVTCSYTVFNHKFATTLTYAIHNRHYNIDGITDNFKPIDELYNRIAGVKTETTAETTNSDGAKKITKGEKSEKKSA